MVRKFLLAGVAALALTGAALAQSGDDIVYIQIEAQPSLTSAERSLRGYAGRLANVNGFSLGGGWYAIALGPYSPLNATELLRDLRREGRVPRDAYLVAEDEYGRQFWPVGAELGEGDTVTVPAPQTEQQPTGEAETQPEPEPQVTQETPAEARRNERQLSRAEREQLQIALQWAGHYGAAIDGAFGRGTRAAMADWQSANGFQPTGVLTTTQRGALLDQYNAVLDGLDMQLVTDTRAGIEIEMPTGVVAQDRVEAPFSIYEPTTDLGARVLLISQPGDRQTLGGLYEIMQTLEIVPLEGPRERRRDGFTLTGENARIASHTEVTLREGRIKGFTLIWPAGDEERRSRVLQEMQASFRPVAGVLDPAQISDAGQAVDLVSGLQIREPIASVSGFFVDDRGAVLTSAPAVESCGRVTLDEVHEAEIVATDAELGLAVLRATDRVAPRAVASFRADPPRIKSEVAVAGYPFGGVLPAPTLTFGSLEDVRGLSGEEGLKRLALASEPGDAGGPVLDTGGAVLGMLLPREQDGRQLPEDVSFAANAAPILDFLRGAGVQVSETRGEGAMDPADLTASASAMTVKVSCWE
ncbi:serine protease [Salipiger mucosus]|uniref:Peptidoglycan binding-like domain-containing protein n=1 Tax=Salipiger mucosus DSM 16094 TaxID=1123237 RepID=S9RKJ0_9RHOB|nr:serine protease [Salipiger mucosus]EPX78625.1 hypothetical protein Salmuc_04206 [Salipiger mucosus DSM 16094]